jgi:hypothetical protein
MRALAEVVPLSSPMVRITGTGFLVPVKLAPVAAMWNAYRKVPVEASVTTLRAVNNGKWHYLASIFDRTNHRFYLDGVSQGTAALITNTALNTHPYIGGPIQIPATFFAGTIDDVRNYNRALSAQEVAQLYPPWTLWLCPWPTPARGVRLRLASRLPASMAGTRPEEPKYLHRLGDGGLMTPAIPSPSANWPP